MSSRPACRILFSAFALTACGPTEDNDASSLPALPVAVANNAVAALGTGDGTTLFSFLGLDATKRWDGITRAAYRLDPGARAWRRIADVPGPPRLASTAQSAGGRVYVFGGYTVAADGAERSVSDVYAYDPLDDAWTQAASMPVPVDDAVSGIWRDSLIFLISGWHDTDNVSEVQIYDPAADAWSMATPIPGPPVFGHAGGIVGDAIVYVDGVRMDRDPRGFVLETSSWVGRIDPADPASIAWERIADHPGPPVYRGAAGVADGRLVFVGGSDNPYNYDGVGYDGRPSEPTGAAFAWDEMSGAWTTVEAPAIATMDHRGLVSSGGRLYTIGGMTAGQTVTNRVVPVPAGD